ncbi:MAG: hypothetical protein CVV22_10945, partial [Ignavibacteriae bacterium HGW-Ignavibacteriae-1]
KEKPFIVHTSNASIRALGTEFNVTAYPNENISEMILAEGSVVVKLNSEYTSKSNISEVVLQPGQKAIIKNQVEKNNSVLVASLRVENCDPQVETSWKDKRWIIKGTDLDRLAVSLSRRYNINIQLKDPELLKYKFSGIIENETIIFFIKPLVFLIFLGICYCIMHYLMRLRAIERFMVYTSLTKYKFWGRRYKALTEKLD